MIEPQIKWIVGIVLGVLILIGLIIGLGFYIKNQKKHKQKPSKYGWLWTLLMGLGIIFMIITIYTNANQLSQYYQSLKHSLIIYT